jgi:VanZ family protein
MMSEPPPTSATRYARRSRLVRYLAVAYFGLVVYASLYPFVGWRAPIGDPAAFVLADWPYYITFSDLVLNVLAYVPLGLLLTLVFMGRMPRASAALLGLFTGAFISLLLELLQVYLPTRIPSNVDLLTNTGGSTIGAAIAFAFGERWILSGELYRLRERFFRPGHVTDLGLALLALWLLTQLNAAIWLFGNGDLRHFLTGEVSMNYAADTYRYLEAAVAAFNFAGVALMLTAFSRSFPAAAFSLIGLTAAALVLKTMASAALFVPGNPALWLTPGSLWGLTAGVATWLAMAALPQSIRIAGATLCLMVGAVVVNLAPENPYLVAALQVLRRGHYATFGEMMQLLSASWTFLALVYLLVHAHRAGAVDSDRSRRKE